MILTAFHIVPLSGLSATGGQSIVSEVRKTED